MITLYAKLQALPPYKVRWLARSRKRSRAVMTSEQIAERAGLSRSFVDEISRMRNWNTVSVETMLRFFAGCGIEPLRQQRALEKLRSWETAVPAYLKRKMRANDEASEPGTMTHDNPKPEAANPRRNPGSLR